MSPPILVTVTLTFAEATGLLDAAGHLLLKGTATDVGPSEARAVLGRRITEKALSGYKKLLAEIDKAES